MLPVVLADAFRRLFGVYARRAVIFWPVGFAVAVAGLQGICLAWLFAVFPTGIWAPCAWRFRWAWIQGGFQGVESGCFRTFVRLFLVGFRIAKASHVTISSLLVHWFYIVFGILGSSTLPGVAMFGCRFRVDSAVDFW